MRLLFLLLLVGCTATKQYVPIPVLFVPDSIMGTYLGATGCDTDDTPVVKIRISLLDNGQADRTYLHEMTHVHQMLEYAGGCRAFLRKYNSDTMFRYQRETEAHCAAFNRYGGNWTSLEWFVWKHYGQDMTKEQSDILLRLICGRQT